MLIQPILPLQSGNWKYSGLHEEQPNPIWLGGHTENKDKCAM